MTNTTLTHQHHLRGIIRGAPIVRTCVCILLAAPASEQSIFLLAKGRFRLPPGELADVAGRYFSMFSAAVGDEAIQIAQSARHSCKSASRHGSFRRGSVRCRSRLQRRKGHSHLHKKVQGDQLLQQLGILRWSTVSSWCASREAHAAQEASSKAGASDEDEERQRRPFLERWL